MYHGRDLRYKILRDTERTLIDPDSVALTRLRDLLC